MPGSGRAAIREECVRPPRSNPIVRVDLGTWAVRRGTRLESLDAKALSRELPASLVRIFRSFREGNGPVALWLRGLPVPPNLPGTPTDRPTPGSTGFHTGAERWLAALAEPLGEVFAHAEICDGHLFHHIVPRRSEEFAPTGESSRARLRMHTDGASHPLPPEFILLWCHRGRPDVGTCIAAATAVAGELGPRWTNRLAQPDFRHRWDYEFGLSGLSSDTTAPGPVFFEQDDRLHASVDVDFAVAADAQGTEALLRLEHAAERVARRVALADGDVLLIDNRRCMHARDAFVPRYDHTERWLQVSYVRRSLEPTASNVVVDERVARLRPSEC